MNALAISSFVMATPFVFSSSEQISGNYVMLLFWV